MAINRPSNTNPQGQSQREGQNLEQTGGRQVRPRDPWSGPGWGGELFSMSPFALLREVTDWMDNAISGSAPSQAGRGQTRQGAGLQRAWAPAMEVRERNGSLEVCADLPGIDQKDVQVEIENDALVIRGERRRESEEDTKEGFHRSERVYGSFYRAIPLPEGVDPEQAKADFHNGVLQVTIPLPQQKTTRRQIQIGTPGSSGKPTESAGSQTISAQSQPPSQSSGTDKKS